jgi:hypothetical protein
LWGSTARSVVETVFLIPIFQRQICMFGRYALISYICKQITVVVWWLIVFSRTVATDDMWNRDRLAWASTLTLWNIRVFIFWILVSWRSTSLLVGISSYFHLT